jgi:hypothetical protein
MVDSGPVYNTILVYIIFITIILFIKPKAIYCHKTKKFKPFGCSKKQTLISFPIICILSVIIFYFIFLTIHIICHYLDDK